MPESDVLVRLRCFSGIHSATGQRTMNCDLASLRASSVTHECDLFINCEQRAPYPSRGRASADAKGALSCGPHRWAICLLTWLCLGYGLLLSNPWCHAADPGGVGGPLTLWLKADAGASTSTDGTALGTWMDQSAQGNHATETTAVNQPLFKNNSIDNINFNPTVDFDGVNDRFEVALDSLEDSVTYSFFAVGLREDGSMNPVLGSVLSANDFFFGYSAPSEFAFRVVPEASDDPSTGSPFVHDSPSQTPFMLGGVFQNLFEERNGQTTADLNAENDEFPTGGAPHTIGRLDSAFFNGRLSEIIVYQKNLSVGEQAQVKSYLAIKYGIPLGQNVSQDYVSSSGAVIWDASSSGASSYNQAITAIGQDDGSGLDQTRSRSTNHQSILTIAENGGGMTDGEFLFWSHNGGTRSFVTTELPSGIDQRLEREWLIRETGEVGSEDLSFDLTGVSLPMGIDQAAEFYLLSDGDGDFSSGSGSLPGSSWDGTVITFSGVDASILNDNTYFTLGVTALTGPAGLVSGIELWLKADAGRTPSTNGAVLTSWADQSGRANDASEGVNGPLYNDNSSDNINFNPSIRFDGSDDQLMTSLEALEGNTDYSIFAVGVREDGLVNAPLGTDLAKESFFMGYNGVTDFAFRALEGGSTISYTASNTPFNGGSLTPFLLSGINSLGVEERSGQRTVSMANSNGAFPNAGSYYVGRTENDYFNGRLSEVIVYRRNLGASEGQKLKSYLAMKYGLSLSQGVAQNYVSSSDVTIWDAASVGPIYNHDITAIGQDDGFPLDQTRSKSSHSESIVTIAENGGGMSDGEFMFWSHDGGTRSFVTTELPPGIDQRLEREWLVQEMGEVGSVDISFDLSGITLPSGVELAEEYFLLHDDDGDFSVGAQIIVASSLAGNVVTFSGVAETVLNNGRYFTLGLTDVKGPAGVVSGIKLWLKADSIEANPADGATVTNWNDQSGVGNNATETTHPPLFQNDAASRINFNPALSFDGADQHLDISLEALEGSSDYTFIAVGLREDGTSNPIIGNELDGVGALELGYLDDTRLNYRVSPQNILNLAHLTTVPDGYDSPSLTPFLLTGIKQTGAEERNGQRTTSMLNSNGDLFDASQYFIGRAGSDGSAKNYNGRICEVLVYNRALTVEEENQIKSYLAIKYGISLGQNESPQNYVDVNGQTLWDASNPGAATYNNDITAIGQDNGSGLDQTQSRSTNHQSILTIAENGGGMADGEFLFWSHNGGTRSFVTTELPSGIDQRLEREWLVQETGEVGSVDLSFDLTGVSLPMGIDEAAEFYLLSDGDGDFSSGSGSLPGSSWDGTVITFSGVGESILNDGSYFTLGVTSLTGPAGLVSGIELWLKAGAGTTPSTNGAVLTSWADQSGRANDASEGVNGPLYNDNSSDNINFNPSIRFDGSDDQLMTSLEALEGNTDYSIFAVGVREDGLVNAP